MLSAATRREDTGKRQGLRQSCSDSGRQMAASEEQEDVGRRATACLRGASHWKGVESAPSGGSHLSTVPEGRPDTTTHAGRQGCGAEETSLAEAGISV